MTCSSTTSRPTAIERLRNRSTRWMTRTSLLDLKRIYLGRITSGRKRRPSKAQRMLLEARQTLRLAKALAELQSGRLDAAERRLARRADKNRGPVRGP